MCPEICENFCPEIFFWLCPGLQYLHRVVDRDIRYDVIVNNDAELVLACYLWHVLIGFLVYSVPTI